MSISPAISISWLRLSDDAVFNWYIKQIHNFIQVRSFQLIIILTSCFFFLSFRIILDVLVCLDRRCSDLANYRWPVMDEEEEEEGCTDESDQATGDARGFLGKGIFDNKVWTVFLSLTDKLMDQMFWLNDETIDTEHGKASMITSIEVSSSSSSSVSEDVDWGGSSDCSVIGLGASSCGA